MKAINKKMDTLATVIMFMVVALFALALIYLQLQSRINKLEHKLAESAAKELSK